MTIRKIEGLLGGATGFTIDSRWAQKEKESYSYGLSDIAILYRFHAQARLLEQVLQRAGLPYRLYGKESAEKDPASGRTEDLEDGIRQAQAAPTVVQPRAEAITPMTLHRSKGLEFPVVFLVGCEEDILPYFHDSDPAAKTREREEERRLFYVGMTRAKNRLFLSYAKKRFLFGKSCEAGPSSFLFEIAQELRQLQADLSYNRPRKPSQPTFL